MVTAACPQAAATSACPQAAATAATNNHAEQQRRTVGSVEKHHTTTETGYSMDRGSRAPPGTTLSQRGGLSPRGGAGSHIKRQEAPGRSAERGGRPALRECSPRPALYHRARRRRRRDWVHCCYRAAIRSRSRFHTVWRIIGSGKIAHRADGRHVEAEPA